METIEVKVLSSKVKRQLKPIKYRKVAPKVYGSKFWDIMPASYCLNDFNKRLYDGRHMFVFKSRDWRGEHRQCLCGYSQIRRPF